MANSLNSNLLLSIETKESKVAIHWLSQGIHKGLILAFEQRFRSQRISHSCYVLFLGVDT